MDDVSVEILIRASSIDEEFKYLKYILSRNEFYEKNKKYTVSYPDNPNLRNPEILKNSDHMYEIFKNSEYDEKFYEKGLNILYPYKYKLEKLLEKLLILGSKWSFKTFPLYQVILTKYGPGGSYSYDNDKGTVTLLTTKDGQFKRSDPDQSIIHEIVHIGIEESIVQKFKLSHWEKERLVDLLVSTVYKEDISNYKMQDAGVADLDNYINSVTILNLPLAIEKYVTEKK